jgi:dTDP-4-amino-4,6-dideoxygalactose transaminase
VHPDTLLLDPGGLERACSERTRCILPVHLYGHPVEMDAILDFARSRGLRVVEDCAQAHGARHRGKPVGGFGEIGCFSFYPTKNLGAFGDAGMCVTDDPKLAESLRMLRMYGFRDDRHAHREGLNSRLDELQAAILRVQLRHLDAAIETRRQLAARYLQRLDGSRYRHPCTAGPDSHAYHLFVVQVAERTRVREALASAMAREICRSPSGLRGRCCRSRSTRDSRMRR